MCSPWRGCLYPAVCPAAWWARCWARPRRATSCGRARPACCGSPPPPPPSPSPSHPPPAAPGPSLNRGGIVKNVLGLRSDCIKFTQSWFYLSLEIITGCSGGHGVRYQGRTITITITANWHYDLAIMDIGRVNKAGQAQCELCYYRRTVRQLCPTIYFNSLYLHWYGNFHN